jgi:hypothetical protein
MKLDESKSFRSQLRDAGGRIGDRSHGRGDD